MSKWYFLNYKESSLIIFIEPLDIVIYAIIKHGKVYKEKEVESIYGGL